MKINYKLIIIKYQHIMQTAIIDASLILLTSGFEEGKTNSINKNLKAVTPSGGTAFRDAALLGTSLVLGTASKLVEINVGQAFHFIHIIMTDGQDTSSKATFEQLLRSNYLIGQIIPPKMLTTYYVGIGLDPTNQSSIEMIFLASIGENSFY